MAGEESSQPTFTNLSSVRATSSSASNEDSYKFVLGLYPPLLPFFPLLLEPAYTRTSFEQNMALPDRTLDAYATAREGANALIHDAMNTADAPEVVIESLIEAATSASPRRRYTCGKVARQVSVLRRFVPERMFDKSLRKQMRLPA